MTTAALYARVSTTRQDLDGQMADLRTEAARRGWDVATTYGDVISGVRARRPGLDRLLADAKTGAFQAVLVWRLDRLGRSLVHLVQVAQDLLALGVDVVSATEPHMDSTTAQGRLFRNLVATFAEYEREIIGTRVREGQARARAKGTRFGRPPRPLDLAEVLARRAKGQSWRTIARALKVPSRTIRRRVDRNGQDPPGMAGQKSLAALSPGGSRLARGSGQAEGGRPAGGPS